MHASLEAVVLVPLLALAYAWIARRQPERSRIMCAAAALLLIFLSFVTELQHLATHTFLWAHLLQNVVLAEWAPALLVLAIPPTVAHRVRIPMTLALPVWLITYAVWHLPWIYDYALRHQHSLLHVEHLTYLLAGLALWWPVVHGPEPTGVKAAYVFGAFVLASPIGLLLALIPRAIYSFYAHAQRTSGPTPLEDQQIAGITMAFEQAVVFFAVFALYLTRFLREEQRDPELFAELRR
ncbi:MAG TPA: cytochrome c oxidase assembly protein [Gaiellaceae bacterium]|jgi:cytochrome c oxidase assembly factor CtaG|nr:cytochrome c oxidase assembly protein [Gaiellaceae bacterium]